MTKYADEKYMNRKITFVFKDGRVWARCPSISKQFLGEGKTKEKAFNSIKRAMRSL